MFNCRSRFGQSIREVIKNCSYKFSLKRHNSFVLPMFAYKFGTFTHHAVTHHTMHPPQNDPPHDAPEPPPRAPKGLGITFYVVDFCYTYYVTSRKSYHQDWLMRFQICQYFIALRMIRWIVQTLFYKKQFLMNRYHHLFHYQNEGLPNNPENRHGYKIRLYHSWS